MQKQIEEEKENWNKAVLIDPSDPEFMRSSDLESTSHRGSGSLIGDQVETQIESSRYSHVKLSQVLETSALYLTFET